MNKIFKSMMAMTIAAFTFTSCEDVPEPYNNPYDSLKGEEPIVVEPTGEGTESSPYNVAGINAYAASIAEGQTDTKTIYVTGIVCSVDKFQEKYGEIDYHIADDAKGLSSQFYVYGGYGLDGAKFTSISELSVGDTVTVAGTITNYQGTLEFQYGSKILSLKKGNGSSTETPDVKTVGSKDTPKTVAEALTAINAMEDGATSEEFWFVKGKVVKVTTNQANFEKYGNLNYLISEDGTENNTITVYSGDGLNGDKFTGIDALKAGDEVIVYGHIQKFVKNGNMTPEISTGNYLVSLNNNGSGNNSTVGSKEAPKTVADALTAINTMEDNATSEEFWFVKGKVVKVTTTQANFEKYGNLNYLISEDGTETNTITVYSGDGLNGNKFSGIDALKAGDEVIVYGQIQKYVKNGNMTPEIAKGNYLVSLTQSGNNNNQGNDEVNGNSISVVYADLGISDLNNAIILTDGTTLTFSQEDGKNPPVYHGSTNIIRMYARNSVTINAGSRKIASVVFTYDTYQGTAYKGNDEMYGQAGDNNITPTKDDSNVTFSNVNNSILKVINALSSGNSGGTQFRCTGVTINYAE